MIRTMINGFLMALADSVPGVSGGTIALILGFYDNLIGSVNKLIYGKKEEKKEGLLYLLKLGLGWAIGMGAAVLVITSFFEKNIYFMSSLFLGFVLASIFIVINEELESVKGKLKYLPFTVLGIALVVALSYLNSASIIQIPNLSVFTIGTALYLFVAGILAITAMFLPGISGSTVLLVFGVYLPVLTGVKEVLHLNASPIPMLLVFVLGIIAGVLLSAKGIQSCLEKYRSQSVYTIIGMLIGSLYAIVLGPQAVDKANEIINFSTFNILAFILGVAVIVVLQLSKTYFLKSQKTKNAKSLNNQDSQDENG